MATISSVVYTPPSPELPFVAVVFRPDMEVLVARAVPSLEAGERLIHEVAEEFAQTRDLKVTTRRL